MNCRVHASLRAVVLAGFVCAGVPDRSAACNVPVFRYAMERWEADPYQVLVYHETGADASGLLRKAAGANCSVKGIDVGTPEGKALAGRRGIAAYPWAEIYYPVQSQVRTPVWSGPLTAERAGKILDSPARSRLARRLLAGEVAVWILVKSGDERKDRRALDSLGAGLKRASATLRIPETGVDANGNAVEVTDFKTYPVRFGLMEVARDDPAEELLVGALMESEPDLKDYREPLAFPVFGRGRALYALVGGGIQERNILEACGSMLAWCSCEIKARNPGTDLLISADWSHPNYGRLVKDPVILLTGPGAFLAKQEPPAQPGASCPRVPAPVPVNAPVEAPPPARSPIVRNLLYLAAAAGVALAALSLLLSARAKKASEK